MMLCENCKKAIASVHLTEIKSGKRIEKHLCEECARSMNLPHKHAISISDLLGALMEKGQDKESSGEGDAECPQCGMTLSEFRRKGRLGCARDYEVFGEDMSKLLEKIHGSSRYVGKVPAGHGAKPVYENELVRLKHRLKKAIKAEAYEEAAEIRDRIIELEGLVGSGSEAPGVPSGEEEPT